MLTSAEQVTEVAERNELFGPAIGAILIALAVSGILDDSGLAPHPWWVVFLISIAALGLLLGARTVRKLLATF